jgi:diketogulonate reductase-like aldo/keto reductase
MQTRLDVPLRTVPTELLRTEGAEPTMTKSPPKHLERTIPRTGELIPAIGLGTYSVFDVGPSESERGPLRRVMRLFQESGSGMVDTSPMYGNAESVVGELAAELGVRGSLFLATKVWTAGREAGSRQMETSLKRLRTTMIDLMQVHNLVDWRTHLAAIRSWQEEGKIRYSGITHYSMSAFGEIENIMTTERPDFVQICYSIVTRRAEDRLLALAQDHGIGVIVNRPFEASGLFDMIRGRELPAWAQDMGCANWPQFFLKYLLSHPAVICVIPATSDSSHLADNLQAGLGPLPDRLARKKMADYLDTLGGSR